MSSDPNRALKIKTGVVQRTAKELNSYRVELEQNRAKIDEIRTGTDQSRLKQWENVLLETQSMIPDTANRLRAAMEDLQMLIDESTEQEERSVEYKAAMDVIQSATVVLRGDA